MLFYDTEYSPINTFSCTMQEVYIIVIMKFLVRLLQKKP